MHDRAEVPPVRPPPSDSAGGRARNRVQPIGGLGQGEGLALDPVPDLLLFVARLEGPAGLVKKECEGVEEWRAVRRRDVSIGDPGDEPPGPDQKRGLLVCFAAQRGDDPLALLYSPRRPAVRPPRVEPPGPKRGLSRPPADD